MSQQDLNQINRGLYVEKPLFNVYTMMLILSFFAICAACFCLNAELTRYDGDIKAAAAR